MLQAVATSTPPTRRGIESDERDPKSFLWLKMHNYRDNLSALESTRFRRPATRDFQYLEIGCGPGNFTTEALLPRLRPCRRLVATDKSAAMVDYASSQFKQRDVVYDVLDIDCDFRNEMDGVNRIVDAYGQFDRVYSFMTFHYVRDLARAYRNVHCCLKQGGECLTVSFAGAAITDVWYRLYHSSKWRHWLPNPRHLLSDRFCYSEPIPEMVATEEQHQIAASGMKLVSCRMYDTIWTMPDLDSWLECYVPFFGLIQYMPMEKRGAFLDTCRTLLSEASTSSPDGVGLRHTVIVVHTQKP